MKALPKLCTLLILYFNSSLLFSQSIPPHKTAIGMDDYCIIRVTDSTNRSYLKGVDTAALIQQFTEEYANVLKSYQTENHYTFHANYKKKHKVKTDLVARMALIDTLTLTEFEGWQMRLELRLDFINRISGKRMHGFSIGRWKSFHLIFSKENFQFGKGALSRSLERSFTNILDDKNAINRITSTKMIAINQLFELKNLNDKALQETLTRFVHNSMITRLYTDGYYEEFNYVPNYKRKDKKEADHILTGEIKYLPEENLIVLGLIWESKKPQGELAIEASFSEYYLNYDNLKNGDYSEVQFYVDSSYLGYLSVAE